MASKNQFIESWAARGTAIHNMDVFCIGINPACEGKVEKYGANQGISSAGGARGAQSSRRIVHGQEDDLLEHGQQGSSP